jgi:hypothetical protein
MSYKIYYVRFDLLSVLSHIMAHRILLHAALFRVHARPCSLLQPQGLHLNAGFFEEDFEL